MTRTTGVTRKFTRGEAEECLRYLYGMYGVAPAFQGQYCYLVGLETALNPSRRLPSPSIIAKFWPNVRDAWLSLGVEPDYDLARLDTGFPVDGKTEAEVRRVYERFPLRSERLPELRKVAKKCGIPVPALALHATKLGLESRTHVIWTEEEETILKSCVHLSKQQIARALEQRGFRRNHQAMRIIRARQRELNSDRPTHYSVQQLSRHFGLDSHCVKRWLDEGWLAYEMKGTQRTPQQGGDTYLVSREALAAFVRKYPELVDFRKVDHGWFIEIIREGAGEASAT